MIHVQDLIMLQTLLKVQSDNMRTTNDEKPLKIGCRLVEYHFGILTL